MRSGPMIGMDRAPAARPRSGLSTRAVAPGLRASAALCMICSVSCLLTTSLDGLEGPPLGSGGGAGGTAAMDGAAPDVSRDGDAGNAGADVMDSGPLAEAGDAPDDGSTADRPGFDRSGPDGDGGSKEPILVVMTGDGVRGIAEHGTEIYWVQSAGNAGVARAPKAGGGQAAFVQATPDAFDVAADDNYVYWSTANNEVLRKAIGSNAASGEFLFSGPGQTTYLAAGSGGRVFATGANTVVVGPRPDAGISDGVYPMQDGAAGIALSGTDLFWSVTAGIVHGDETLSPAQSVYSTAPGAITGIATDGREIYWLAADGAVRALVLDNPVPSEPREVCRARVDPPDAEAGARPDGSTSAGIRDVAIDEEWIYFAEPALRFISKCARK